MPDPLNYETPPVASSKKKSLFWLLLGVGIVVLLVPLFVFWFLLGVRSTSTVSALAASAPVRVANAPVLVANASAQFDMQSRQIIGNRDLTQSQQAVQLADLISAAYQNGQLPTPNGMPSYGETMFLSLANNPQTWDAVGKDKCMAVLQSIIDGYPDFKIKMPAPSPEPVESPELSPHDPSGVGQ